MNDTLFTLLAIAMLLTLVSLLVPAAERLRLAVTQLSFLGRQGASGLNVTVSVGVAMLGHGDDELAKTIERADRALYLAKERGRNRVEYIEEPRLSVVA